MLMTAALVCAPPCELRAQAEQSDTASAWPDYPIPHQGALEALLALAPEGALDDVLTKACKAYDAGRLDDAVALCQRVLSGPNPSSATRAAALLIKGWALARDRRDVEGSLKAANAARSALEEVNERERSGLLTAVAQLLAADVYFAGDCEGALDWLLWGLKQAPEGQLAPALATNMDRFAREGGIADELPLRLEPFLSANAHVDCAGWVCVLLGLYYRDNVGALVAARDAFMAMEAERARGSTHVLQPDMAAKINAQIDGWLREATPSDTVKSCVECWKRGNLWVTRRVCLPDVRDEVAPAKNERISLTLREVGESVIQRRVTGYTLGQTRMLDEASAEVSVALEIRRAQPSPAPASRALLFVLERHGGMWLVKEVKPAEGATR